MTVKSQMFMVKCYIRRLVIANPKKSIDKIIEAIKSHFSAPRLVEKILPSPPKAAESAELLC